MWLNIIIAILVLFTGLSIKYYWSNNISSAQTVEHVVSDVIAEPLVEKSVEALAETVI